VNINGTCDPRFKRVKQVFADSFANGLEVGAATIDANVIDLWKFRLTSRVAGSRASAKVLAEACARSTTMPYFRIFPSSHRPSSVSPASPCSERLVKGMLGDPEPPSSLLFR
jgi:hypothetical protein